ncbi:hypothetical protein MNBD_GAMMA04-275 [hydrothermal vent metagenome]|uniref:Lipoprotein n=1 Tax=hydrothermal vent metagenome TaxID=652676 RepID=A0A3B0VPZ7_9ZZZZ
MRQYIHIIFTILLITLVSGCLNDSVTVTSTKQGITLRNAINTNDHTLLTEHITLPLVVTKQEWETADDGYGYILGAKDTLLVNNSQDLTDALRILDQVRIEGEKPLNQEFTIIDFTGEFIGIEHYWKNLELVVFFRGQGDVEHIVVLGLDKKSAKLRAIYIN